MKKIVLSGIVASVLVVGFSGCTGNNSLNMNNTFSKDAKTEVVKTFQTGKVTNTSKVLINDRKIATLAGAGIGGVAGVATRSGTQNSLNRAGASALIGAGIGFLMGKEVVAFQTTILSKDKAHITYLKNELPYNTKVEFVTRGSEISNVNVIKKAKVITKTKTVYKDRVVEKKVFVKPETIYKDKVVEKIVYVDRVKPASKKTETETVKTETKTTEKSYW